MPLLKFRYGGVDDRLDIDSHLACSSRDSIWWRDIVELDRIQPLCFHWFEEAVLIRIGNGNASLFWTHRWLGSSTLKERFSRLFSVAVNKNASAQMCYITMMIGGRGNAVGGELCSNGRRHKGIRSYVRWSGC
jgi:hypothetical protein